jgi:hypothetical protein
MPFGNTRFVLYLRAVGIAVKLPRRRNLRLGLHCNRWEREMWRVWRPQFGWESLCPMIGDPWGLIVIMPLAGKSADPDEAEQAYPQEFYEITSEGKPDDYRWLGKRIVVVDYGLECEMTANERRAYYRGLVALRR